MQVTARAEGALELGAQYDRRPRACEAGDRAQLVDQSRQTLVVCHADLEQGARSPDDAVALIHTLDLAERSRDLGAGRVRSTLTKAVTGVPTAYGSRSIVQRRMTPRRSSRRMRWCTDEGARPAAIASSAVDAWAL